MSTERQALLDAVQPSCPYPTIRGTPAVRAAMAAYVERRFGVRLDPETQAPRDVGYARGPAS